MAVDSKQGSTTNAPPPGKPLSPAATLAGMPALTANGAAAKRKRPSSLLAAAGALPSVENSLDEFIAKANETLIDPSTFNSAQVRQEEDVKRKEHDALRWKATEQQMLESEHREQSLRRQLDGLQGKLAEAEARAAVGHSGGSQDGIIADLKLRLTMADEKVRSSEEKLRMTEVKVGKLEQEVFAAQSAAASAPPVRDSLVGIGDDAAEERVRFAEAKAAKAIAAARAAAAGLTVSQADIAAIESGLSVSVTEPSKKLNWGGLVAAFIVGGAIMFAVAFVALKDKKPAATAAGVQPAAEKQQPQAAPAAAEAPAKPTVTPIDDDKAAAPAAEDTKAAAPAEDTKAEDTKAADAADKEAEKAAAAKEAAEAKAEAAAAKAEAAAAKKPAAKKAAAAPKKAAPKKAAKTEKKASAIADPFGDAPAPAPKKKAEKKAAGGGGGGGIVDPF